MADEELVNVSMLDTTGRKSLAKLLRDAGFAITASQLDKRIGQIQEEVITKIIEAATYTIRQNTPIDTGELANEDIQGYVYGESGGAVVIEDIAHFGRRGIPIQAPSLADILDTEKPSTKGWKQRALAALKSGAIAQNFKAGKKLRRKISGE
jgi:hypothetical protein